MDKVPNRKGGTGGGQGSAISEPARAAYILCISKYLNEEEAGCGQLPCSFLLEVIGQCGLQHPYVLLTYRA